MQKMAEDKLHEEMVKDYDYGPHGNASRDITCVCGRAEETTGHMSQLAHPCYLDDFITFNDVGKQCVELCKIMV